MRYILTFVLIVFAGVASAQSYPEPSDLSVNDFAGIMDDEAEQRLAARLDTLREQTDVEMVIVTLSRQDMFAPDISLKKFARGIFDEWGIGDKKRDDGILVLVLRGDQAIRITLGKGYDKDADKASDKAVERSFLPEFREDRYETGIEKGVDDLIENLVQPYAASLDSDDGATTEDVETASAESTEAAAENTTTSQDDSTASEATEEKGGMSWLLYILGGIGALIAFFTVKSKTRKCPECGARGTLSSKSNTIEAATETNAGKGERITSCEKCDYKDVNRYEIAKLDPKADKPGPKAEEPEGFSGGEAGKKGTTGKW